MNIINYSTTLKNLDKQEEEILDEFENLIKSQDKNKNIQIHTVPLNIKFYIEYQRDRELSLPKLIDNTFNKYINDINNLKEQYLKDSNNTNYADKRYKNYITQQNLQEIKTKYMDSYKLNEVDKIVVIDKPYFQYLLFLLNGLNSIKYIDKVQFNSNATQYKNDTYKHKLDKEINEAQEKCNMNDEAGAKLSKGLIDTYQNDKIEGSLLISILNKVDVYSSLINENCEDEDYHILKQKEFFNKSYKSINFTLNDLYIGYSQLSYWNYGQADYNSYKQARIDVNKQIKKSMSEMSLSLISKEQIRNDLYNLFELVFGENIITPIRAIATKPQVLKYYDNIMIPTIKDISTLEEDFFKFFSHIVYNKRTILKEYVKNNFHEIYAVTCQIRPLFY